jgi:hypothetical protein
MFSQYGLSSGFFGSFQNKLERLYRIRDLVYKLLDEKAEEALNFIQALTGSGVGGRRRIIQRAGDQARMASFAAVENILTTLKYMAARYKEMETNKLMMWQSIVSARWR